MKAVLPAPIYRGALGENAQQPKWQLPTPSALGHSSVSPGVPFLLTASVGQRKPAKARLSLCPTRRMASTNKVLLTQNQTSFVSV